MMEKTYEYVPRYCVWELTLACNLRCRHCGSKAGRPRANELSIEECMSVVVSLARLGCEVLTLSGGEPTLHPAWESIAQAAFEQGMHVNMVTNGYALDAATVCKMKNARLSNVAVSIDGPKAQHEMLRGRGTFDPACRSLSRLKAAGISTVMMTTINTLNMKVLGDTCRIAEKVGAERWRLQLGKAMGNMRIHQAWVVEPRDLLTILPKLHQLSRSANVRIGIGDSLGFHGTFDEALRSVGWKGNPQTWMGCQAGLQAVGIEADGGIKGCLSMQAELTESDPLLEGNLRSRSLESIWQDPNGFEYNRRFDPSSLGGFCRKCHHRLSCRGGAKCVAAASTGWLHDNPYCYHRVKQLTSNTLKRNITKHIAAASIASMCLFGHASCGLEAEVKPPTCEEIDCKIPDPAISIDDYEDCCGIIDCNDICCECDYGIVPAQAIRKCC